MVMAWIDSPHVKAFWDNSPEHREDIRQFATGRRVKSSYFDGVFSYWIGKCDGSPFCLVMTSPISQEDDIPSLWRDFLSATGKTFSIDFCIGNESFVGKGLAASALEGFMAFFKSNVEPEAHVFLIDPDEENTKARHVYAKAGFKLAGSFDMPSGYFSGKPTNLMVKIVP